MRAQRVEIEGLVDKPTLRARRTHGPDLLDRHGAADVLLVREHEQAGTDKSLPASDGAGRRAAHLLLQQRRELNLAVAHPRDIARVDDPDERVGAFEVVGPVRPQGPLSADVPCAVSAVTTTRSYRCSASS